MRIALLDGRAGAASASVARGLRDAGHEVRLIAAPPLRVAELLLAKRGFTPGLSSLPRALALLVRFGDCDLAHAFTPADAAAALAWRRRSARPVVYTCGEVLGRGNVADRRLRLALLQRALEESDLLLASSDDVRESLRRWFALDAPVLPPGDHEAAYRRALGGD